MNAGDVRVGARPADGSWPAPEMIALPLDDGASSSGRYRYRDIAIGVEWRIGAARHGRGPHLAASRARARPLDQRPRLAGLVAHAGHRHAGARRRYWLVRLQHGRGRDRGSGAGGGDRSAAPLPLRPGGRGDGAGELRLPNGPGRPGDHDLRGAAPRRRRRRRHLLGGPLRRGGGGSPDRVVLAVRLLRALPRHVCRRGRGRRELPGVRRASGDVCLAGLPVGLAASGPDHRSVQCGAGNAATAPRRKTSALSASWCTSWRGTARTTRPTPQPRHRQPPR